MADPKNFLKSTLENLLNIAGNFSDDVIEFNSEIAETVSSRMKTISGNIYNTCSTVTAITSQTQGFWTGKAAESFISKCEELVKNTDVFYQKLEADRKNIELAAQRLTEGDTNATNKVEQLSTHDIF